MIGRWTASAHFYDVRPCRYFKVHDFAQWQCSLLTIAPNYDFQMRVVHISGFLHSRAVTSKLTLKISARAVSCVGWSPLITMLSELLLHTESTHCIPKAGCGCDGENYGYYYKISFVSYNQNAWSMSLVPWLLRVAEQRWRNIQLWNAHRDARQNSIRRRASYDKCCASWSALFSSPRRLRKREESRIAGRFHGHSSCRGYRL